jgi:hypothetical protein
MGKVHKIPKVVDRIFEWNKTKTKMKGKVVRLKTREVLFSTKFTTPNKAGEETADWMRNKGCQLAILRDLFK